jgi:hypothetical protein
MKTTKILSRHGPLGRTLMVGGAVLAVGLAAGCGAATTPDAPATVTETVAPPTVTEVVTVKVSPAAPAPRSRPSAPVEPVVEETPSAGRISVPGVVGWDHQLAQDTMQAAGLYSLTEEDATGQGRLLLWDRNWTVVSQSPAAGMLVTEDTTILLRSKKDDE